MSKKIHYFVSDRLYFYGSPKGTPILSEKLLEATNLKKSISGGLKLNSFKNCYLSLELSSKNDLFFRNFSNFLREKLKNTCSCFLTHKLTLEVVLNIVYLHLKLL